MQQSDRTVRLVAAASLGAACLFLAWRRHKSQTQSKAALDDEAALDKAELSSRGGKPYLRATAVDASSDASVAAVAAAICPELLRGGLAPGDLVITPISGGITNKLKRVERRGAPDEVGRALALCPGPRRRRQYSVSHKGWWPSSPRRGRSRGAECVVYDEWPSSPLRFTVALFPFVFCWPVCE